jgi:hypothetical protein
MGILQQRLGVVTRDEDHWNVRQDGVELQCITDIEPCHPRHTNVQQYEIRRRFARQPERHRARSCEALIRVVGQHLAQELDRRRVVVDQ